MEPTKNRYTINPLTHRQIQIGGNVYKKLVKEGIIRHQTGGALWPWDVISDISKTSKNLQISRKAKTAQEPVKSTKGKTQAQGPPLPARIPKITSLSQSTLNEPTTIRCLPIDAKYLVIGKVNIDIGAKIEQIQQDFGLQLIFYTNRAGIVVRETKETSKRDQLLNILHKHMDTDRLVNMVGFEFVKAKTRVTNAEALENLLTELSQTRQIARTIILWVVFNRKPNQVLYIE